MNSSSSAPRLLPHEALSHARAQCPHYARRAEMSVYMPPIVRNALAVLELVLVGKNTELPYMEHDVLHPRLPLG